MKKGIVIPVYDLGTLVAGFYIGYNEGKGIPVSHQVEYLTKYGPSVYSFVIGPIARKAMFSLMRYSNNKMIDAMIFGDPIITSKGKQSRLSRLDEDERNEFTKKILIGARDLESTIQKQKYIKPALISGARTAILTTIGYTAGRLYSNIG